MSSHELERVEDMGRVSSGDLKLSDAAVNAGAELSPEEEIVGGGMGRWAGRG